MAHRPFDSAGWKSRSAHLSPEVRIHYIDCPPPDGKSPKGVLLLIHGFPQTSYQFRHAINPLAAAGYRIIVPDYRGTGSSSHPRTGYTKTVMAADLHSLIRDHLDIKDKIHLVGHDIGGMIAHAYASRYSADVASATWGECPLPGTTFYDEIKNDVGVFHFTFHQVLDLPEALVAGHEKIYLKHFFDKITLDPGCVSTEDLEHYTVMYSQPGAMRCAMDVYRAFETDKVENLDWLEKHGKCRVPSMVLSGKQSFLAKEAGKMVGEIYVNVEAGEVEDSGHYLAEENPEDFVRKVLGFVGKHS